LPDLSPPPTAGFLPFTKQCLVNELLWCQRIKHLLSLLFFEQHAFNGQVLWRELFRVFDAIFMAVRVVKGLFRLRGAFLLLEGIFAIFALSSFPLFVLILSLY
jgi:hypothetical protein